MKKLTNKYIFYLLQWTWGIIANLIGLIVFLFMLCFKCSMFYYHNSIYLEHKLKIHGHFSLGCFCFITTNYNIDSLNHESGHSLQNAVYGIFYLVIALMSALRFLIKYQILNKNTSDYYNVWYEKEASDWGGLYD